MMPLLKLAFTNTYQAKKHRSEEKPFEVVTVAYLSTANLNLPKWPSQKPTLKYIGPFQIPRHFPIL